MEAAGEAFSSGLAPDVALAGIVSLEQAGHMAEAVAAERHETLLTASLLPVVAPPGGRRGPG